MQFDLTSILTTLAGSSIGGGAIQFFLKDFSERREARSRQLEELYNTTRAFLSQVDEKHRVMLRFVRGDTNRDEFWETFEDVNEKTRGTFDGMRKGTDLNFPTTREQFQRLIDASGRVIEFGMTPGHRQTLDARLERAAQLEDRIEEYRLEKEAFYVELRNVADDLGRTIPGRLWHASAVWLRGCWFWYQHLGWRPKPPAPRG